MFNNIIIVFFIETSETTSVNTVSATTRPSETGMNEKSRDLGGQLFPRGVAYTTSRDIIDKFSLCSNVS